MILDRCAPFSPVLAFFFIAHRVHSAFTLFGFSCASISIECCLMQTDEQTIPIHNDARVDSTCGIIRRKHPRTYFLPVHVPSLWADPWLASVDAGVVQDCRDVLVSIPDLKKVGVLFVRYGMSAELLPPYQLHQCLLPISCS